MLLVYCPQTSNRLKFIFRFIFNDIIGAEYKITTSEEEYKFYKGPKLNYSKQNIEPHELHIVAHPLLFETGIKDQSIKAFVHHGEKAFFETSKVGSIPFDLFAASFYMVSRYEEYLPTIRDSHDRFNAHQSMAYANGFLQKPIVDVWAFELKHIIAKKYPEIKFTERKYKFISTIDIDNAYAYKHKGFIRTNAANLKAIVTLNYKDFKERILVLLGKLKDPYDTYELQRRLHSKYKVKTIYFFLVGDYGVNDKSIPAKNHNFQHLIKSIADYSEVGVHPSYASTTHPEKFETEIIRLEKILNRDITKSRQHFLKINLPDTYRRLIELDITDDYTLGFAREVGFRAGTCTTFNFYDLDLDIETKLRLHPFQVMDATLKYYMKVPPNEAMSKIEPLIKEINEDVLKIASADAN